MNYQDPSQIDAEKRLLLALVLSMAVVFTAPHLYQKFFPAPPEAEQVRQVQQTSRRPIPAQEAGKAPPVRVDEVEAVEVTPTRALEKSVAVENEDLILRWSNVGAILQSARLKHYASESDPFLEIIPQGVPEGFLRPLEVRPDDEELAQSLSRAVYEVQGTTGKRTLAPAEITFRYRDAKVEVSKKIRIPARGYVVEVETEVRAGGRLIPFSVFLGSGIGEEGFSALGDFGYPQIVSFRNDSVGRYTAEDLEEGPLQIEGKPRWVALDSKHFSYLMLNPDGIGGIRLLREEWKRQNTEGEEETLPLLVAELRAQGRVKYAFFAGPKDSEILNQVDSSLSELIDYGWFKPLVRPLLFCLKLIYGYIHNYGWAIIVLTFLINLVLFPIRYKQMVSMKKMSAVQPQLKSIQDKYKKMKRDDPRRQRMNKEVMALYSEHGVNPLGGCLPLLLQMPFLFAFYRMLDGSIELRGAPFMFWIQDLSRHDPYYVTPVVMGVSMLAQQAMTPATGDPTQRRMMMFLPIIFTFFFLNLSSGLVLYFLFSNAFAMMFQFLVQKWNAEPSPSKPSTKAKKN